MKNFHEIKTKFQKRLAPLGIAFVLIGSVGLFGFGALPALAQQTTAATPYVLLAPLPYVSNSNQACADGSTSNADGSCQTNFVQYLLGLFKLIIALSAILAVVMITYGGLEYIMSASFGAKQDGKERITNAVVGLLLALASYLILYTINPNLVSLKFSVPACTNGATTCPVNAGATGTTGSNGALLNTNDTISNNLDTTNNSFLNNSANLQNPSGPTTNTSTFANPTVSNPNTSLINNCVTNCTQ